MIEFRDISLRIGRKTILDSVSFSLPKCGITVLVGRNGSGKSSLLSCATALRSHTGQVLFDGADLAGMSPSQRAKQIALLPQSMPAPHITAFALAAFGRTPHLGISGKLTSTDEERVHTALAAVNAADLADRYVDTLSGGERQRIALAMVLAQDTPCILLDEPTAHLDPAFEAEVLQCLLPLKQHKSILLVLHDLSLAAQIADHVAVLDGGRLRFFGSRDACLSQEVFENVFGVRRFCSEDRIFFAV